MDFKIVEERDNKVLGRKELSFEVENSKTTPSRKELRKRIAALKNSKEELVSVASVKQCYGEHRAKGLAFVYKDIERLQRIEPGHLIERESKKKKEKKEEAKPAAEAGGKEEKPAGKKEEPKNEEAGGKTPKGKKEDGKPEEKGESEGKGAGEKPQEKKEEKPAGKKE